MGPLTLPTHGPVYLDANGFIYSVERVEPYSTLLEPMWQQARAGEFDVASSDITVLETLVKPLREGDEVVEMLLRSMFDAHEVSLIPATRELWEDAARIRADTGLKTPDALHAATALSAGCAPLRHQRHRFSPCRGLAHRRPRRSDRGGSGGMTHARR